MFTGLIQTLGEFRGKSVSGGAGKLYIRSREIFRDLQLGESIAVNGTCLTLEEFSGADFTFHVLAETFSRTDLGDLVSGNVVNMERALAADGRLGGHIVSGHVDGTGEILSLGKQGADIVLEIGVSPELLTYIVPKGSIAVDGISLTVASIGRGSFTICIIPTTWNGTNLRFRKKGDRINLETDMIGKYVYHFLARMKENGSDVTMNTLAEAGFLE